MEDISRKLEREIADAKPNPCKIQKEEQILIIDNFGHVRPGGHLKILARVFFVFGLMGVLAGGGLGYLFLQARDDTIALKTRLTALETKVKRLTTDKEILMARLVMAGKDIRLKPPESMDANLSLSGVTEDQTALNPVLKGKKYQSGAMAKVKDRENIANGNASPAQDHLNANGNSIALGHESHGVAAGMEEVVSVEKFTVTRMNKKKQFGVQLNIRNISKTVKEISGRIFVVIKQDDTKMSNMLVLPGGKMSNGIPGPYRKGKYFSITRFKPVGFTVNSDVSPERFTIAEIYIFSEEKQLLLEKRILISDAS